MWLKKKNQNIPKQNLVSSLKIFCQDCLVAKENYIWSYEEKYKEQKGQLCAVIFSYVMAMFWMFAAQISLVFKKRVVEKATEGDSKHDEYQEHLRNWT